MAAFSRVRMASAMRRNTSGEMRSISAMRSATCGWTSAGREAISGPACSGGRLERTSASVWGFSSRSTFASSCGSVFVERAALGARLSSISACGGATSTVSSADSGPIACSIRRRANSGPPLAKNRLVAVRSRIRGRPGACVRAAPHPTAVISPLMRRISSGASWRIMSGADLVADAHQEHGGLAGAGDSE